MAGADYTNYRTFALMPLMVPGQIPVEQLQETIRRILLQFPPGAALTNHVSRN